MKYYESKINTNFHDDGMPIKGSHSFYLSEILIDSDFKVGKNCYTQMLLEERKMLFHIRKMSRIFAYQIYNKAVGKDPGMPEFYFELFELQEIR